MESALGWIGSIFDFIGSLLPRLVVVRSTHGGVRFRLGRHVSVIKPGLTFYLPIVTEVDIIPTCRQCMDLTTQTLMTADGQTVAVSGLVTFEIDDPIVALAETYDPLQAIEDTCMGVVKKIVVEKTLDELVSNVSAIDKELASLVSKEVETFGVRVLRATFTDVAPCIVLKLWSDSVRHGEG